MSPCFVALLAVPVLQQGDFVQCTRVLRTLTGEAPGDQFGWVSAPVPDVTGDGREELLVGAPFHASGGANAGRVYLHDVARGVELFHADGGAAQERLGHSLRAAGDLDQDGTTDVIAGGPGGAGTSGAGRVFSGASGAELLAITFGSAGTGFGYSVDGVGDVDGDGLVDFAVGAPLDDAGGVDAGRVFVVSGRDGTTVLRSFTGSASGANLGTALGRLADLSGDGVAELLVGAANAGAGGGRAYVFDLATGALHFPELVPDGSAGEFGQFFASEVGLVNADLVPDFYVGDFADGGSRGKAYVFDGASGARLWTFTGQSGDGFGIGRGLGDTNGDGRADLVFGSWTQSGGATRAGRLEIFSGADASRLRRVTSTTANEALGFDAHGLGDLDGDGRPELVGTAASFASGRGRVYVIADRPLETIGAGLAGAGGAVPTLDLGGCPRLAANVTLDLANAVGGGSGTLYVGAGRRDRAVRGGVLHPFGIVARQVFVASGSPGVPGAGAFSLPVSLPADPALAGLSFHAQVLVVDAAAPAGLAFTPGLRLTLY